MQREEIKLIEVDSELEERIIKKILNKRGENTAIIRKWEYEENKDI